VCNQRKDLTAEIATGTAGGMLALHPAPARLYLAGARQASDKGSCNCRKRLCCSGAMCCSLCTMSGRSLVVSNCSMTYAEQEPARPMPAGTSSYSVSQSGQAALQGSPSSLQLELCRRSSPAPLTSSSSRDTVQLTARRPSLAYSSAMSLTMP
jgi:hypothetical protein